jgi:hypothetical protein
VEADSIGQAATIHFGTLNVLCGMAYTQPSEATAGGFWKAAIEVLHMPACDWRQTAAVNTSNPARRANAASTQAIPSSDDKAAGLLFDVDLGVPTGVRVGYEFGRGHGVGLRLGGGAALISGTSLTGTTIFAAFGRIGLGGEGRTRLEPTAGVAAISGEAAGVVGLAVAHQFIEEQGARPGLGIRLGADLGIISSMSLAAIPDAALTLSW